MALVVAGLAGAVALLPFWLLHCMRWTDARNGSIRRTHLLFILPNPQLIKIITGIKLISRSGTSHVTCRDLYSCLPFCLFVCSSGLFCMQLVLLLYIKPRIDDGSNHPLNV